jgi:hypothetical protein
MTLAELLAEVDDIPHVDRDTFIGMGKRYGLPEEYLRDSAWPRYSSNKLVFLARFTERVFAEELYLHGRPGHRSKEAQIANAALKQAAVIARAGGCDCHRAPCDHDEAGEHIAQQILRLKTETTEMTTTQAAAPRRTLRDEFAMAAITGLSTKQGLVGPWRGFARDAYALADALMAARDEAVAKK